MRGAKPAPLTTHGWTVFAHPLFMEQVESLVEQVEALKKKDSTGYVKKNATKRLAAIARLAFDVIPQGPARAEYRQGARWATIGNTGFTPNFFSSTAYYSGTTLPPR